jgi:hypothetical protein
MNKLQSQIKKDKGSLSTKSNKYVLTVYGRKLMKWKKYGAKEVTRDYSTGVIYRAIFKSKTKAIQKANEWKNNSSATGIFIEELKTKDMYYDSPMPTYYSGTGLARNTPKDVAVYPNRKMIYEKGSRL